MESYARASTLKGRPVPWRVGLRAEQEVHLKKGKLT
jgi:hypothetical protein